MSVKGIKKKTLYGRIGKDKQDSIWYGQNGDVEDVAHLQWGEREALVVVDGDIRLTCHKGKDSIEVRNGNIEDLNQCGIKNDKDLARAEEKGKLSWDNNNWFSIWYRRKGDKTWQEDSDVQYKYDHAISSASELLQEKEIWDRYESDRRTSEGDY